MQLPKKPRKKRRPSTVPYTDAIKTIKNWFIEPFIRGLEMDRYSMDWETGVRHFFSSETREIGIYRAMEPLQMPGKRQTEVPAFYVVGEGRRQVKIGQTLLARIDEQMPDRVDVEYDEQVFLLSAAEWQFVSEKLKKC